MKKMVERLAWICVLPIWFIYKIRTLFVGKMNAFMSLAQRASQWPGIWGVYRRRVLFRQVGMGIGREAVISFGTILSKPTAVIGHGVYIGSYCMLGDVQIGGNTLIADHVCIPSGAQQHGITRLDIPMKDQPGEFQTIQIGLDCWIGSQSVILANVGNHCVIGAGSVITKPVGDYQIVAGNPARVIGDRYQFEEERKPTFNV